MAPTHAEARYLKSVVLSQIVKGAVVVVDLLAGIVDDSYAFSRLTRHDVNVQRLRDRVEDYLDHRAPVRALVIVGVVLFAVALVLLLLLPHPSVLQLAGVFAIATTGSWILRTGIRVKRERGEAALAGMGAGHAHTADDA